MKLLLNEEERKLMLKAIRLSFSRMNSPYKRAQLMRLERLLSKKKVTLLDRLKYLFS